ncbi:MAG: hypothetical protein ACE366_13515 [Bradymonadia bacterium]
MPLLLCLPMLAHSHPASQGTLVRAIDTFTHHLQDQRYPAALSSAAKALGNAAEDLAHARRGDGRRRAYHQQYRQLRVMVAREGQRDDLLLDLWDDVVRHSPARRHRRYDRPALNTQSLDTLGRACDDIFPRAQIPRCVSLIRGHPDGIALVKACGDAMGDDRAELQCVEFASQTRFAAAPMVQMCEQAMGNDQKELECIKAARQGDSSITKVISACEDVMDGDDAELKCVVAASSLHGFPEATVRACDAAFSGDDWELRCIDAAAGGHDMGPVVKACEEAMSNDENELKCVQLVAQRSTGRRVGAEAVRWCDDQFSQDARALTCIQETFR